MSYRLLQLTACSGCPYIKMNWVKVYILARRCLQLTICGFAILISLFNIGFNLLQESEICCYKIPKMFRFSKEKDTVFLL